MKKINEKAFTLIELLGVLVVLVVLMLIISPLVLNFIKSGEENINEQNIRNIELAAENWGTEVEYHKYLPETGSCYITVEYLMNNGFLDNDMKASDGTKMQGYIVITPKGKSFTYKYTTTTPSFTKCTS